MYLLAIVQNRKIKKCPPVYGLFLNWKSFGCETECYRSTNLFGDVSVWRHDNRGLRLIYENVFVVFAQKVEIKVGAKVYSVRMCSERCREYRR